MTFGRAILGDNQFLGVNHANQAKAAELYERFKNPDAILEVIAAAYAAGVRDFMFTTHERYDAVFDEIRRSNLFPGMYYTPCPPYAHKYWNKLSERGLGYLLMSTVGQMNPLPMVPAGLGLLAGRMGGIMHLPTRMETVACKGLPLRGVFLQNLAFDFVMAMELYGVIEDFANAVSRRLGVIPGFVTMNHPKAVETLCDRIGLDRPWLCANYNIAGFRMNPSAASCEASFAAHRTNNTNNIAMSILASGRASASEAVRYVRSKVDDGGVDAILFGSSSEANIRANLVIINGRGPRPAYASALAEVCAGRARHSLYRFPTTPYRRVARSPTGSPFKRMRNFCTSLLVILALSGCSRREPLVSTNRLTVVQDAASLPPPNRQDLTAADRPALIGPLDTVQIDVFNVPDLSREMQVDASGRIAMPLVGTVDARGKTAQELGAAVETALRGRYVRNPEVTVNIKSSVSQVVTIDGQVVEPGLYPVTNQMTLLRAIASAKGLSEFARLEEVVILRTVDGRKMAGLYDIGAIRRGAYDDPPIYANDVVVVGDSPQRRLFRDVVSLAPILAAPLIAVVQ